MPGWRLLDHVPLGSPRDRPLDKLPGLTGQDTPEARRPLCLAITGHRHGSGTRQAGIGEHFGTAPLGYSGHRLGSPASGISVGTPQAVQAWSSGFLPVGCIVFLQYDLPFCGFCGIMSHLAATAKSRRRDVIRIASRKDPVVATGGVGWADSDYAAEVRRLVESLYSKVRFCSLAGCIAADYSESNQIKGN